MLRWTFLSFLSVAIVARAQDGRDHNSTYIAEVCQPNNSSGYPDLNAPCNHVYAIQMQCVYGSEKGLSAFHAQFGPESSLTSLEQPLEKRHSYDPPTEQSASAQRKCMCDSPGFSIMADCIDCQRSHGSKAMEAFFDDEFISSMSAAYCAPSATPTVGMAMWLFNYVESLPTSMSNAVAAVEQSTTAAADTLNEQAKPTGAASGARNVNAAKSTTQKGAASNVEAAAIAGVFGIAGLVALL